MGKLMRMPNSTRSVRERTPFGQRMYEARRRSGLTQGVVCAGLGITQGTLSGLESSGQGSRRVAEFARIYGCDAAWLATGQGSPGWASEPARPASHQHVVSEAEWRLLQDVRMALNERELEDIHARASLIRKHVEALVQKRLSGGGEPGWGAGSTPLGVEENSTEGRTETSLYQDSPGLTEESLGGRSHFGELDESLTRPAPTTTPKRLKRI